MPLGLLFQAPTLDRRIEQVLGFQNQHPPMLGEPRSSKCRYQCVRILAHQIASAIETIENDTSTSRNADFATHRFILNGIGNTRMDGNYMRNDFNRHFRRRPEDLCAISAWCPNRVNGVEHGKPIRWNLAGLPNPNRPNFTGSGDDCSMVVTEQAGPCVGIEMNNNEIGVPRETSNVDHRRSALMNMERRRIGCKLTENPECQSAET